MKSVRVPDGLVGPFEKAEQYVEGLFSKVERKPEDGIIRIGGERYVFMRCESLYMTWFDSLEASFGRESAQQFVYNTAREIGRSDSAEFSKRLGLTDGVERLSCGPGAASGWYCTDSTGSSRCATPSTVPS